MREENKTIAGALGSKGLVLTMGRVNKNFNLTNSADRLPGGPPLMATLNSERRAFKRGFSNTRSIERTFGIVVHRNAAPGGLWLSLPGNSAPVGEASPSPRMLDEIMHSLTLQE
jgi:hypothetical protein